MYNGKALYDKYVKMDNVLQIETSLLRDHITVFELLIVVQELHSTHDACSTCGSTNCSCVLSEGNSVGNETAVPSHIQT